MTWRRRAASLAGRIGFGVGLHHLLLREHALIVVFHRIDDRYPKDPVTVSRRTFTEYCDFFVRHFRTGSLQGLLKKLTQGESVSRYLVITFDDGYRDNHEVAAPILESFGLRATFFITTGFIGSATVPWWDREQGIGSEWMTWEQVTDLQARGHEVGGHTVSHQDLAVIDGDPARREIVGCKRELEQRLGNSVTAFAYPYGRANGISGPNRALLREAGFSCCAGAFGGLVPSGQDPFGLHRIPVSSWYGSTWDFGQAVVRSR